MKISPTNKWDCNKVTANEQKQKKLGKYYNNE